ncbi:unnamed protein product [Linum trigynum]|uniref:CCHC-type domain-containing protein n=1 Tax=Linum trigynum TaxID=586398 RepID=A0AAV2FGH3_9ROSI
MEGSKLDCVSVKFNGKNFPLWELHFRVFVHGRGLLPILDGSLPEPDVTATAKARADWAIQNAQVTSWLLSSMEPGISLSLRAFTTAHAMWQHLLALHSQTDISWKFEIEFDLAALQQGDMDVRSYYQKALDLWTEQDMLTTSLVSAAASEEVLKDRASSRLVTFMMKLHPAFEGVRASLQHRNVSKIEDVVAELIREETRLRSKAKLDGQTSDFGSVFAVQSSRPQFGRTPSGEIICYHCKESGHIQIRCPKKQVCNYCKAAGHLIGDCPILARRNRQKGSGGPHASSSARRGPEAPAYATTLASSAGPTAAGSVPSSGSGISQEEIRRLVRDAIQESLPTALTAAFSTGMIPHSLSQWHLDSAAVNHMTSVRSVFENLQPSSGISLQVADGSSISVARVGSVKTRRLSLPQAYYVPKLTPNLVSVGQLADDGCRITFDGRGCTVQDMRTGAEIRRGSKRGRIYMLESYSREEFDRGGTRRCVEPGDTSAVGAFTHAAGGVIEASRYDSPISTLCDSYSGYSVQFSDWDLWHFRLGHPNKSRLFEMFKNNWLSGRVRSIPDHECVHCVEAKISQRSFSSNSTVYSEPFDLVHTDLWGPSLVIARMGYRYFALFIDHVTRFTWVYFLNKSLNC